MSIRNVKLSIVHQVLPISLSILVLLIRLFLALLDQFLLALLDRIFLALHSQSCQRKIPGFNLIIDRLDGDELTEPTFNRTESCF